MSKNRGIFWFRNDLRLHDNEALREALSVCHELLLVYIFDDRIFKSATPFGFAKTGKIRSQFIIESVQALQHKLEEECDSQLNVYTGITEDIIYDLARKYRTKWVFCNRERTREEVLIQDAIEQKLWSIGQEMRYSRGKMLLYTADLPFPVTHTPDQFSTFKKEIAFIPIRQPLPNPHSIPTITEEGLSSRIPGITEFGWEEGSDLRFRGGESCATHQLKLLRDNIRNNETDNMLELSPWISHGCLSPKSVFHEMNAVKNRQNQETVEDCIVNLLRRDHFRFMGKKFGNKIFLRAGVQDRHVNKDRDMNSIRSWCKGQTGEPLIDAAMQALVKSGMIPNRLRILAAMYLIYNLKQDWLVGAEFFESHLIDYDACSNYGNWSLLAGVGPVKRDETIFNIEHQTNVFDPERKFIKKWLGADSPSAEF